LLLSSPAYAVVEWLTRRKIPTSLAIVVVVLIAVGLLGCIAFLMRESALSFVESYPRFQDRVDGLWEKAITSIGLKGKIKDTDLGKEMGGFLTTAVSTTLGSVLSFLSQLVLVLFYLIFLLIGHHLVPHRLKQAFKPERAQEIHRMMDEIQAQVLRYILLKTATNLLSGSLVWAILALYGVEFALLWGILVFVACYIPNVGSVVATIPPVAIALIQFPSPWKALQILLLLIAAQSMVGSLIEPRVLGRGLDLDPVLMLVSLVFFGWIWGVVGAIFAVPLMVVVKITCSRIDSLRPVALLMGSGIRET
jgi:AI-2 transport protein TqsA